MSWPMVKLADIANVVTGATPKKRSEYYDGDVPFVTPGDLGETSGITSTSRTLTQEGADSVRSIPAGSVMVCCIGATIGKVGIAEKTVVTNQQINSLVVDERKAFPKYVYYYCATLKEKLKAASSSTTMPIVNKSNFSQFEIPLPPLEEQKRIATILDKADAIRQKRKQAIKLADEFLRSVFLDMFGDPVTNPKGLSQAKLTEFADVITGFAFKSAEYVEDDKVNVRLCRGVNTLPGYFDWKDTAYWDSSKLSGIENYKLNAGDVILAMDRPWISSGLKVCVFPDNERDTYLVQRVARMRPKNSLYTDYLYSSILSKAFERHCCPTETTVPHISPVELKNFSLLMPDEDLLKKYNNAVTTVRKSKLAMEAAWLESNHIFESLSQKAFSGQL